jgi:outer membrane protein assembly factor BamE
MMLVRAFALGLFLLAGCTMPSVTPYKMDVQQGNVVTREMVAKLKPGMTPAQVRFILGTPLVVDAFHKDRWDYVYRLEKGGRLIEHRRIVVVFKDDKLDRLEGDVTPGPGKGGARGDEAPPAGAPASAPQGKGGEDKPAAEKPGDERGFFGRMLERLGF